MSLPALDDIGDIPAPLGRLREWSVSRPLHWRRPPRSSWRRCGRCGPRDEAAVATACRRELLRTAREAGLPLAGIRFVPRDWLSKTTSGKLRRRPIAADLMEARI
jgi:hypothetical protein